MTDRLFEIPNPPREPKWRAGLRHRWVLGLMSGIFFLISSLMVAMMLGFGLGLPFDDMALDSQSELAHTGEVLRIEEARAEVNNQQVYRIHFRFHTPDGAEYTASSTTTEARRHEEGSVCAVEYLEDDPSTARIQGTRVAAIPGYTWLFLAAFLLPAFIGLLVWFRGVLAVRTTLRDGTLVTAEIKESRGTRYVNPPQVHVAYEFTDRDGQVQRARQSVKMNSRFARLLLDGLDDAPAIFDPINSKRSRLVTSEDFTDLSR